jgi:four helix bundle protein
MGSLAELETQFEISLRLRYLQAETVEVVYGRIDAIAKMLKGVQKSLKSKNI